MDLVTNCSSLPLHVYYDAITLILEVHVHAMVAHLFCNTVSANNNYTCIMQIMFRMAIAGTCN